MTLPINMEKKGFGLKSGVAILMAAVWFALTMSCQSPAETGNQRTFASPEEAVSSLMEALRADDVKALEAIFGPDGRDLLASGDPVADQSGREKFLQLYTEKNRLESTADKAVLSVGNEDWPFPIPVVKEDTVWRFDTEEGYEEILARRIGRNELNTIQTCLAYGDAQREYVLKDRNADGFLEYAQKIRSDKGMQNGLYWETKEGEEPSPLGLLFAEAQEEGYNTEEGGKPAPYHGYYFRPLNGQGNDAPGGAYDYMVGDKMIGGFALIAFPATYESSGIMTFIVNHDGVVYQKDLGQDTEKTAQAITLFNPDSTWEAVEEKDTQIQD